MKARTIGQAAASLAVIACLAGAAMTGSKVEAQNNPLQGLAEAIQQACENAWASSPAYSECGPRAYAPGSTHETVEWVIPKSGGVMCEIRTGCVYLTGGSRSFEKRRRSTEWRGRMNETSRVQNCDGYLQRHC